MSLDAAFTPLSGGCKCAKVRFLMQTVPIITHVCHCRTCQRISGSAFRVNAMIETDRLKVLHGRPELFHAPDIQKVARCADCGVILWSHVDPLGEAIAMVGLGVLDEGERLRPEAHYFTRSKHPWIVVPEGVPAFEELGDIGKPGSRERVMAALAASGAMPSGAAPSGRAG